MNRLHPYDERYRQRMDAFQAGLWAYLDTVPVLESDIRDEVVQYLLELACRAQNIRNITLGRTALLALPRVWLLAHIEHYAEPLLQLKEEWEYRRLAELYEQMDDDLVRRLVIRGLASPNEGIQEAAQEYQAWLQRTP
jgi:hypothetical protein